MRIFDLHADIGTDILEAKEKLGIKDGLKVRHLAKLENGGIGCSAVACYFTGKENWERMQQMVLNAEEQIAQSGVHQIKSAADLDTMEELNLILTVEGMCGITEKPEERIQWLYDHGVRIASLCWNEQNALASGKDGSSLRGLTELGRRAVKKMNELNLIIDVSHANEKTFWDILEASSKPVIATHSNLRFFANVDRNLSDQQFKALAEKGGLSGLNAAKNFIAANPQDQNAAQLALHAVRMKELAGIEHIGVGFDFMDYFGDHENAMGSDLSSALQAQNLVKALQDHFSEEETEQIVWNNTVRFLKQWL